MGEPLRRLNNQGMVIMSKHAEGNFAAALDWIQQAAATGKTSALRTEAEPAEDELVGALLPIVPSEHKTAILAHHIRKTLSTARPGPVNGVPPADHDTFRYADPYTARCPDCDNETGAAAEARRLVGRWAQ
jgi:hypothetical protein